MADYHHIGQAQGGHGVYRPGFQHGNNAVGQEKGMIEKLEYQADRGEKNKEGDNSPYLLDVKRFCFASGH
jgi:hypothetical protein